MDAQWRVAARLWKLSVVSLGLLVALTACTSVSLLQDLHTGSIAYDAATTSTVVFGGEDCSQGIGNANGGCQARRDTWIWNGHAWAQPRLATKPPARAGASMAYDATRQQVVLFGGEDCSRTPCRILNDTWTWDGQAWVEQYPQHSPPARQGASLAYDAARRQVVLFGGNAGIDALADTWVWDGQQWTEQAPPSSPPARFRAKMAYDGVQQRVVLFGGMELGQPGPPQSLHDTWTWDGRSWTQAMDGTMPLRVNILAMMAEMTADEGRGTILLVGTVDCTTGISPCGGNGTWVWDGTTWVEQQTATTPTAALAGMTYDGTRQTVVLFGGPGCSAMSCNGWAWDGHTWNKFG
jgi:hypothetical protein